MAIVGKNLNVGADRFAYSGTELDAMSAALNYHRSIARVFQPYFGSRVLEIGSGIGTFSQVILASGSVRELIAVEPAANNLSALERRLSHDTRARVIAGYVADVPRDIDADSLVAVNVLEHVEHPGDFLIAARNRLRPGGHVLLFVPALRSLFGSLDHEFGHFRRYSRPGLLAALDDAGFEAREVRYFNLVGAFAWFVLSRIVRAKTLTRSQVSLYDRYVIPWVLRLEEILPPPFGQSLIAVARRSDAKPAVPSESP